MTNDETHHLILDKSVPNIRMNTVLQVFYSILFYLFDILKIIIEFLIPSVTVMAVIVMA